MKNWDSLITKVGVGGLIVLGLVWWMLSSADDDRDGIAIGAATMIVLGVVITVALYDKFHDDDDGEQ